MIYLFTNQGPSGAYPVRKTPSGEKADIIDGIRLNLAI